MAAGYSKRRRCDVQPIRDDLAKLLGPWIDKRDLDARVWDTSNDYTAAMMEKDLEAARAE